MVPKTTVAYYFWHKVKPLLKVDLNYEEYKIKIDSILKEMLDSNERHRFEANYKDLIRSVDSAKKLKVEPKVEPKVEEKNEQEVVRELKEIIMVKPSRNFFQRLFGLGK